MSAQTRTCRRILPNPKIVTIWIATLVMTATWVGANLDNPPEGYTGAPGEETCNTAGCHDEHPVYSYVGDYMYIWTDGSHVLPGDTVDGHVVYAVASNVDEFARWAFDLTVVDLGGNASGELLLVDSVRTELATGGNGRQYLRSTPEGTLPDTAQPRLQRWDFRWVAPLDFDYPVTLYTAAVGANDNGAPTGDWVNRYERWLYNPEICFIETTGDVNWDGVVTTADIIQSVNFIYKGDTIPVCMATADVNCSRSFTSADILYLVDHVFRAGQPPCDVCDLWQDPWTCP